MIILPRLSLLPVLLREILGPRTFPREPEPDLVMDNEEQVQAYARAGRIDGVMASAYLYHSARISRTIHGCKQVIDLGCGPATQLAQVAQLNPDVHFTGVDLSGEMLQNARAHISALNLPNVDFIQDDISKLDKLPDNSCDGVISTMALHHLPTRVHLEGCFSQVSRVLASGGAIYFTDFGRLKSLKSVLYFAYMNRKHQPHIFSLDYERSLRAAFEFNDFSHFAEYYLPTGTNVSSTALVPFLVLAKTPDRNIPDELTVTLKKMRLELPFRYRRDLDDLRLFFRIGGNQDPFE